MSSLISEFFAAPRPHGSMVSRFLKADALRRSRAQLARLDATQLADIGLSREDAVAEARRPLWDVPGHWLK